LKEALKTLAAALKALETVGLRREDVWGLRSIISSAKIFKELIADYINYRAIEGGFALCRS
jgi:hypothetical protein